MPFETRELQKFTAAGRAIADAAGATFERWATEESGIILKSWAGEVKLADPAKAVVRSRSRSVKEAGVQNAAKWRTTVNSGRRGGPIGRVFFKRKGQKVKRATKQSGTKRETGKVSDSGAFIPGNTRFKDADWNLIQGAANAYGALVARLIPAGQRAIGLARQSVVQIADALGIALETVKGGGPVSADGLAKARTALASDGKQYVNGTGTKDKTPESFFIEMVNRYPQMQGAGVDTAFENVLAARLSLQASTLNAALAKDSARVTRNYPYLIASA